MHRPAVQTRSAVVTGCSTGIGRATALLLRERGWRVLPTARKPEDLDRLRSEGFEAVRLDLADEASVEAAAREVLERLHDGLGGIVNNAGIGVGGAVEDLSREALRRQFEVNVFGLVDFTNRLLPAMRAQGWGRIVNVSSVLGRVATPLVGAYCASKFALEALSDAWRVELWATGIAVSVIEPGPIESEFRRNAAETAARLLDPERSRFGREIRRQIERRQARDEGRRRWMWPPETVARAIAHALESQRPRRRYPVTWPARAGALAARFAPMAWLDWINRRAVPDG
ncbi:MAG: SDR family NAD(P)-dependent oxidoreductase [Kiritimatiellae bacterium]|nr:SDR family NAD(P)-dependent oxidoreductase [Kiritimatiellia bacterium]